MVILISFLFPRGEALQYSYKLDDITREPIIAPVTFPILKNQNDYEKDKEIEKKSVPFIFNRGENIVDNQLAGINEFFKAINVFLSYVWLGAKNTLIGIFLSENIFKPFCIFFV